MIAIFNSLPLKGGDGRPGRREDPREPRQRSGLPGLVCMEVLRAEAGDEVLVITPGRNKEAFDAWVHSEDFCAPSAFAVPRLTVTPVG
jgi:heme-degrading monooxygenase HmoA